MLLCQVWNETGYHYCMVDSEPPYTLHKLRELTKISVAKCYIPEKTFALLTEWIEPCLKDKQN